MCNLDELVYGGRLERKKPSRKSKWLLKKAGQWPCLIDLAASRKRKGPPVPGEEGDECQLCGREAAATQEGVRLIMSEMLACQVQPWAGSLRATC